MLQRRPFSLKILPCNFDRASIFLISVRVYPGMLNPNGN